MLKKMKSRKKAVLILPHMDWYYWI